MKVKVLFFSFILILSFECVNAQQPVKKTYLDTINLLTSFQTKFWDRIDTFSKYKVSDNINWCLRYRQKKLIRLEYYYDRNKVRKEYVYGGDLVLGETLFDIRKDTITVFTDPKTIYLIQKLSKDTLMLLELNTQKANGKSIYINSRKSQMNPIPFVKSKRHTI